MRILVTGYKGFIGHNISQYLIGKGHVVEGWEFMENAVPDPSAYDWVIHLGAISDTTFTDVEQIMSNNFENSDFLNEINIKTNERQQLLNRSKAIFARTDL